MTRRGVSFVFWVVGVLSAAGNAQAAPPSAPADPSFSKQYRELILKTRPSGTFRIAMPSGPDMTFSYQMEVGRPMAEAPSVVEIPSTNEGGGTARIFLDKVRLKAGSYVVLGGKKQPLTCIFVDGQDNRGLTPLSPLFPVFVMKVYLVANDFACKGPKSPGFPSNGSKEEAWDTYLYFEVRDPTIMLPAEVKVRFRWNEWHAVLVDEGAP